MEKKTIDLRNLLRKQCVARADEAAGDQDPQPNEAEKEEPRPDLAAKNGDQPEGAPPKHLPRPTRR